LREHLTKDGVHNTKHNGVGHRLDKEGLSRGEGEENTRGEENEENDGDNDVEIHVCCIALKNISFQKYIHVNGETFSYISAPSNPD